MINQLFIKLIIIVIIVSFTIPAVLIIYGNFQTMAEEEFDLSQFSGLFTFQIEDCRLALIRAFY
jgi:ABC-type uncharacterized transport system permease subunit